MLLTKLMWTPSRRWLPEHSRQQNAPKAKDPGGLPGGGTISEAHLGCRSGQSLQIWFWGFIIWALSLFLNSDWLMVVNWSYVVLCVMCGVNADFDVVVVVVVGCVVWWYRSKPWKVYRYVQCGVDTSLMLPERQRNRSGAEMIGAVWEVRAAGVVVRWLINPILRSFELAGLERRERLESNG
jgi:hypothetical protein